jgi:hypothetical protein
MRFKKLLQEFTPEELADQQLAEAVRLSREKMTRQDRLAGSLMELRFRMEDYFNIQLLERKRREFAVEIGINETLLSQLAMMTKKF